MDFESLRRDPDIMRMAKRASSYFTRVLSKGEIENCILIAIWKASKAYDKSIGPKISTFVYNGVVLECFSQRNKELKSRKIRQLYYEDGIVDHKDATKYFDLYDELKDTPDGELLIEKYIGNKTYKEIGNSIGKSGERIRNKIQKVVEIVRERNN